MPSRYILVDQDKEVEVLAFEEANWRANIFNYLKDPSQGASKWIRYKALRYMLIGDDIYYHNLEGLLLKCLGLAQDLEMMHDLREKQTDKISLLY